MEDEGMSKNKLAGITGMSSRTLQRVFNGPSTQKIPFATLVRIAHGLELEIVLKEEPSLKDYLSDRVCLA
jgi:DNA-binding Xre family transcriptional regulator